MRKKIYNKIYLRLLDNGRKKMTAVDILSLTEPVYYGSIDILKDLEAGYHGAESGCK